MRCAGRSAPLVARSVPVRIPKLGLTVTEATFIEWLVEDGAVVDDGQVLYRLETDKVETDVPAAVRGRLQQAAEPGQVYAVGAPVGSIYVDE
jgi:pyruvate dehydrogenase E2 component (dihydrolipoamide acetyltransferase)